MLCPSNANAQVLHTGPQRFTQSENEAAGLHYEPYALYRTTLQCTQNFFKFLMGTLDPTTTNSGL